MLFFSLFSKSSRYTPSLMTKRWKVRILPPKEKYDDDESRFMKKSKPKKSWVVDAASVLHRKTFSVAIVKDWLKWKNFEEMKADQRYLQLRHQTLGPDLAATHFLTARGGKVRFVGNSKWITAADIETENVPSFFVPGFNIEEIDVSGMDLLYEGFDNFCNLIKLKKLNLSNCPYIDDWCLSRFHLFATTLEYLDLSGCNLVTERGICTLHTLKKLKTLVIKDNPNIQNKELVCLLLQDIIPDCDIIGVNFNDPVLLKRIENCVH